MAMYDSQEQEDSVLGRTMIGTGQNKQEITANEKVQALKSAYEDP